MTGQGEFDGCGDLACVTFRVSNGRVAEVRFQAYGGGPTIAAASAAGEFVVLRPLERLRHLKPEEVECALDGLPDDRRHAAAVAADAVRGVARNWLEGRD